MKNYFSGLIFNLYIIFSAHYEGLNTSYLLLATKIIVSSHLFYLELERW